MARMSQGGRIVLYGGQDGLKLLWSLSVLMGALGELVLLDRLTSVGLGGYL